MKKIIQRKQLMIGLYLDKFKPLTMIRSFKQNMTIKEKVLTGYKLRIRIQKN